MTDAKIDPDVTAGFDRLEAMAVEAGPSSTTPVTGSSNEPAPWKEEAALVVEIAAGGIAPNWTFTADNKATIVAALAKVLNKYMPGGLAMIEQWGPWAELAAAVGFVAVGNMDWQAMKLRPLKASPEPKQPETGEPRENRPPESPPKRRSKGKQGKSTPKKQVKNEE